MGGRTLIREWRSSHASIKPHSSSSPISAEIFHSPASSLETTTPMAPEPENNGLIHLNKGAPIPDTYSEGTFPIDIIAVHGLNGGARSTWTHKNGNFWLGDMLPKQFPGARIYSFGYQAKVFRSLGTGGFEDFARELLEAIKLERGTPALQRRPIIFVCHSMGGIVVKKALNITAIEGARFRPILTSTVAILFLATPHKGAEAASAGAAIAKLSHVPFLGVANNSGLVTALKLDSKDLMTIAREFRHFTKDMAIYSFFEQSITPGVGLIVDQKSGSMNVDTEVVIPMGGYDHRSICRYEHEDSVGYKRVLAILKEVARNVTIRVHSELVKEDWPCLQSLAFSGFAQSTDGPARHPETCGWLLEHPTYRSFTSPTSKGNFLLLKGLPGSGKSTLMSFLSFAYTKEPSNAREICLSFFFKGNGSMLQRSKLGMLRSLLWQIYKQSVNARNVILAKWEEKQRSIGSQWTWIEDELFELLVKVLQRQCREVFIFVDAIDESVDERGENSGTEILTDLQQLVCRIQDSDSIVRICVSCRHYPVFTSGPNASEIVVEKSNAHDLRKFVRSRLEDGVRHWYNYSQDERMRLERALTQTANGVFLWVELRMRKIVKHLNDGTFEIDDLSSLVETESNELFPIYRSMLEHAVADAVKGKPLLLMQWVCLADRPLRLEELRLAMACDDLVEDSSERCESLRSFVKTDDRMARLIGSLSGGLAIVDKGHVRKSRYDNKSTVQLFHATVYEFMRNEGFDLLSTLQSSVSNKDYQNVLGMCEDRLSKSCLKYLTQKELLDKASKDFEGAIKDYPFVEYATKSWMVHAERAEYEMVGQEEVVEFFECRPEVFKIWKMLFYTLEHTHPKCPAKDASELIHTAACWNIKTIVKALVDNGVSMDDADGWQLTPLHHACQFGYEELVEYLIDNGANITGKSEMSTTLEQAAKSGHEHIVKLLLNRGVDINKRLDYVGSALQVAAQQGNLFVASMLIRNGAQVNAQGGSYGNALKSAAYARDLAMVKLLLENGADVNQEGGTFGTALHSVLARAPRKDTPKIVQVLLDAGANPNTYGCQLGNAFQSAAKNKHLDMVKLLLRHGAELDSCEGEYGSALHAACSVACDEVVEFLLSQGADVNQEGGIYGNPLQAVAHMGDVTVMKLILKHGGDVHLKGGLYGCVLQAGAASHDPVVVPVLIDAGAVDIQGGRFGNALQAAVHARNFEVAKYLLKNGADMNQIGGEHGTALQAAVMSLNEPFVRYLLDCGADVNLQGGEYHTALQAAVVCQKEPIVKLLIDHGAQVNAMVSGCFALQVAARRGKLSIVQLLLDNGADVNLHGKDWQNTALYEAVLSNHMPIVGLLLDRGAKTHGRMGYFDSALHAARGELNMTNFLLSRGVEDGDMKLHQCA